MLVRKCRKRATFTGCTGHFPIWTMSKYKHFFMVGWIPYDDKFRVSSRKVQEVNVPFYLCFLTSISAINSCMLSEHFYPNAFLSSNSPKFNLLV